MEKDPGYRAGFRSDNTYRNFIHCVDFTADQFGASLHLAADTQLLTIRGAMSQLRTHRYVAACIEPCVLGIPRSDISCLDVTIVAEVAGSHQLRVDGPPR